MKSRGDSGKRRKKSQYKDQSLKTNNLKYVKSKGKFFNYRVKKLCLLNLLYFFFIF